MRSFRDSRRPSKRCVPIRQATATVLNKPTAPESAQFFEGALKSQTEEGASSLWDMLRKHVEQGNIPAEAPPPGSGVQVKDMDPKVANEIFKDIFGKDCASGRGRLREGHHARR